MFALVLFGLGLFGVITCKNLVKILICIEIMLNAVAINFVAFAVYDDGINLSGVSFGVVLSMFGLVQAILIGAILYFIYKYKRSKYMV